MSALKMHLLFFVRFMSSEILEKFISSRKVEWSYFFSSYHCSTLKFFFDSLYLFRMEVMLKKKKHPHWIMGLRKPNVVMKFILSFKLKSSLTVIVWVILSGDNSPSDDRASYARGQLWLQRHAPCHCESCWVIHM